MSNKKIKIMLSLIVITTVSIFTVKYMIIENNEIKINTYRSNGTKKLYAACDSGYDTVTAKFMIDFSKRVYKKSNGRIVIETYSDSQVGNDLELLNACQSGNISFVFQTTAPQATLIPQVSILDSPMAFKNKTIARRVLDGKLLKELEPYYEKKGLELLGFSDQGFREMTSNYPVKKISDFNGIKIRTMENPYHIMFWKLLGANPTPMAYSEVYIGLQQGIVDAQENPVEAIIGPKFYEQQKYIIMTNHIIHTVGCTASKKVMDALNITDRKIITDSIHESIVWSRNETDRLFDIRMKTINKNGTEKINVDSKLYDDMRKKSEDVWKNIEKNVGSELMNTFKNEIKKYSY